MWILVTAVVTASVMGSLHCVGMCGPLALWVSGGDRNRPSGLVSWWPTGLYHVGRWASYAGVGVVVGGVGQLLDWSGDSRGLGPLAARIAGGLMILAGLVALVRFLMPYLRNWWMTWIGAQRTSQASAAIDAPRLSSPNTATHRLGDGNQFSYAAPQPSRFTAGLLRLRPIIFQLPLPLRGFVVGLLTALLPCGWLYLFALLAASTGSWWLAAVVMSAFWLGSVPALVGLIAGSRLLVGPIRPVMPVLTGVLMIVAGAYTVAGQGFAAMKHPLSVSSSLVNDLRSGRAIDTLDAQTIRVGMQEMVSAPLPCCQPQPQETRITTSHEVSSTDLEPRP
ncbi:MAG: sulfite exporter TauE/SafE family protein [Pirellulaceae bacterium]|nr:sulfite exporter TauE/SafE family protein [Pirellulaceae bacterium]